MSLQEKKTIWAWLSVMDSLDQSLSHSKILYSRVVPPIFVRGCPLFSIRFVPQDHTKKRSFHHCCVADLSNDGFSLPSSNRIYKNQKLHKQRKKFLYGLNFQVGCQDRLCVNSDADEALA